MISEKFASYVINVIGLLVVKKKDIFIARQVSVLSYSAALSDLDNILYHICWCNMMEQETLEHKSARNLKKKFKATSLIYKFSHFYGREWKHAPHIKMFQFERFYIGPVDLFLRHWKIFLICCKYFYFFFLKKVLLIKGTAYFMHLTKSKDKKKRISQALGVWSLPPPPFPPSIIVIVNVLTVLWVILQ